MKTHFSILFIIAVASLSFGLKQTPAEVQAILTGPTTRTWVWKETRINTAVETSKDDGCDTRVKYTFTKGSDKVLVDSCVNGLVRSSTRKWKVQQGAYPEIKIEPSNRFCTILASKDKFEMSYMDGAKKNIIMIFTREE